MFVLTINTIRLVLATAYQPSCKSSLYLYRFHTMYLMNPWPLDRQKQTMVPVYVSSYQNTTNLLHINLGVFTLFINLIDTGTEGMRTRDLQNGNSSIYRNTDSNENFQNHTVPGTVPVTVVSVSNIHVWTENISLVFFTEPNPAQIQF